jgi:hypothetical protein
MKKIFIILIIIFGFKPIYSHQYEGLIRAYSIENNVQVPKSVCVAVFYQYNGEWIPLTNNNIPYVGWTSTNTIYKEYNGGFCVAGVSDFENNSLFPEIPYDIATQGIKLVIDGCSIDWVNENNGDSYITYCQNTGQITVVKPSVPLTYSSLAPWIYRVIQVKNSFDGGQIQFNNDAPETITSGAYLTKIRNDFPVNVIALPDQTAANYYVWNSWSITGTSLIKQLTAGDYRFSANFLPAERLVFQDVPVIIEQTTTAAANTTYKAKLNYEINITLNSDVFNSMLTTFVCWNKNGTYYGNTRAITYIPTAQQITTFSVSRDYVSPVNSYRNQHYGTTVGQPITIYWSEHPLSNVSYQIWRRVRHNGVTGSAALLDTLSHGTTSYIDYDYLLTSSFTDDLLFYDVRAVYSVNSSTSAEDYIAVYGAMDASKQSDDIAAAKNLEGLSIAPVEYSLGSYPNPFNPTTVIRYTMPEAGQVSLKVYNILSQEVANLIESSQSAGVHQVNFNASHLPTGIYIARLQAGAKVMTIKLQLIK